MNNLIENAPGIIKAAGENSLTLVALSILVIGVLAFFYFRGASEMTRIGIFVFMGFVVLILILVLFLPPAPQEVVPDITPPGPPKEPTPTPQPDPNPQPNPPPSVTYTLRAVFTDDPYTYYVTSSDDIVVVTPQGQIVSVGRKIPPTFPGFVWMYATASITYGVDSSGRIWNRYPTGVPIQVGYVTTP